MSSITFSGLGSGLDTSSLISQLVAAEKQPANLLMNQQQDLTSQKGIVDNIAAMVDSLHDLVQGMSLGTDLQFRTANTSDSHVSVAVSSSGMVPLMVTPSISTPTATHASDEELVTPNVWLPAVVAVW